MKKAPLLLSVFSLSFSQEVILEKVEVLGKREVLEESRIRELPVKDPGEALEINVPGVWKIRKGAIANDVVIRGFKKEEVNQLFDGARVYNACPNRMDPGIFHVDFSEVERIEVIKGPFDVRNYGSVGGSVNVITKEPKRGFGGEATISADSWNYFNPSLNVSYGSKRFSIILGYAFRFSKPYEDGKGRKITELLPPNNPNAYSRDEIDSTAFNIHTIWSKFSYKLSKDLKLKVAYTHQKANDVLYPYLMMDALYDEADRINFGLEGKKFKVQLYGSSVRHWMTNQKRVGGENAPKGWSMGTYAKSKVYGFKGEIKLSGFSVGVDTFYRNWDAQTTMYMMGNYRAQYTIPDVDFINFGVFSEYRRKFGKFKLVAGLRLDYTKEEAGDKANKDLYRAYHGTTDTSKTDIYPSGNVQLFYSLFEGGELFIGIGSAARVPDPQERFFALNRMGTMENMLGDWVGNPNLDPERNNEIDVGFKFTGEKISIDTRAYFSYVKDYIYVYRVERPNATQNKKAMSYTNIDAYFYGFELSGSYAITETLFLEGSTAYTRGRKKDTYPEKNINDKDIAEIPPLTARLSLRYDTGTYFGEVEGILTATQNNVDSDLQEEKTSGYGIMNIKLGGEYKNFKFIGGIKNVFDKLYYNHLSYLRNPFRSGVKVPEPGRTYYLTVSYVF